MWKGGEIRTETVFAYHERDGVVWAAHAKGSVRRGYLVATRDGDRLDIRYAQLNIDGPTSARHGVSVLSTPADGRLRLDETWEWQSRRARAQARSSN